MTYNDIVGSVGVGLILLAFFLSTIGSVDSKSKFFFILNGAGAALACYASFLINYWPFVVLEGIWALVSLYGLFKKT